MDSINVQIIYYLLWCVCLYKLSNYQTVLIWANLYGQIHNIRYDFIKVKNVCIITQIVSQTQNQSS